MAEIAIGIDLGTSNSCVAMMQGGELQVIPNAFGERTSASVVHFRDDGTVEVGNSAKAKLIHAPATTVASAKRLIGRYYFSEEVKKAQAICSYEIVEAPNHGVRIQIREEEFSLPEISAMVLREMKQIAERHLGDKVTKAVITVPAYFNDNQRQATKDAGRIAGLEVLRILNEPTAAALAYGFGMGLSQRVAVYDLGGGTFDISILEIGKDVFEVLATCGDTFLGGDDFDDRILDLLADEFVGRYKINPRNDPYAFEKLKAAAEYAKKQLSEEEEIQIDIPEVLKGQDGAPLGLSRKLTRVEFAALVQDLILRTFKVCDEALQQSDLTVRDLDGVILVGGPTRLPMIREAVTHYFQREPRIDVDPDEVVAMGAAIHAASLVGEVQDSMLLDVTPLDLRIGVAGGLAEPVIERNTPVPIEQTRTFTTVADYQETVQIRVYQGDHRLAEDNTLLGEFEFSGFQKGPRSDVRIDVTFEIDADGIVSVTASDQATGEKASTTITLSSGLGADQLEAIIEQDVAGRVVTADAPPAPVVPQPTNGLELAPNDESGIAAPPKTAPSAPTPIGRLQTRPVLARAGAAAGDTPAGKPSVAGAARPVASSATPPPPAPLADLDALDDLELDEGDLESLDEDLDLLDPTPPTREPARKPSAPTSSTAALEPDGAVEIELDTEATGAADEDGFFDRSGRDLTTPDADDRLD
ncbi:MAG: molecular chaperone DnaK [Myxococcota bacterium]